MSWLLQHYREQGWTIRSRIGWWPPTGEMVVYFNEKYTPVVASPDASPAAT
jgi:hypothetical protein